MFKMNFKSFLFIQCLLLVYAEENVIKLEKRRLHEISNKTFAILETEELAELWLINCDIRNIDKTSFQDMRMLKKLRLNDNKISELHIDTFKENRLLDGLDLSNNELRRLDDGLLQSLWRLTILFLNNNNIEFIGEKVFYNLHNLDLINLANNRITRFHDLQFKDNLKLEEFQLKNNYISDLNFMNKNLTSLKKLSFESNKISELQSDLLFNYLNLVSISLKNNIINRVTSEFFSKNLKLQFIDLSENLISEIKPRLFSNLNHLETLSLHKNKISGIEDGVFPNTTTFRHLNLNSNGLEYLNASVIKPLHGLRREGIGLGLNPWICDCYLQELYKEWKVIGNPFIVEPTCDEPVALKGKEWNHLKVEDFQCGENDEIDDMVTLPDDNPDATTEEFAELIETLA